MLLLILLGAAAVLAVLSIPVYCAALRPRRGTTEWMRCIETPHFLPLRICRPHLSDLGWLPLAVVLGVGLRLLLQLLRTAATASTAGAVLADLPGYALHVLLPCAALAAGMYLLIRLTAGGVLASICGAAAISVLQGGSLCGRLGAAVPLAVGLRRRHGALRTFCALADAFPRLPCGGAVSVRAASVADAALGRRMGLCSV